MKSNKPATVGHLAGILGLLTLLGISIVLFWPFSRSAFNIEGFATEKQVTFVSAKLPDPLLDELSKSVADATQAGGFDANHAVKGKNELLEGLVLEFPDSSAAEKAQSVIPADFPKVATADWRLQLVGPDHKLQAEVDESRLTDIGGGERMDARVAASFNELLQGAAAAGVNIDVVSAYRSVSDQTAVFNEKFERMKRQGKTDEEAERETMTNMTRPGYSEHHTGLAVDVVDEAWLASDPDWTLDERYGTTKGGSWLAEHVADYGFVIRYPADKTAITKITYEPWHLRYVGKEVAGYMTEHGLCLEEFVAEAEKWEQYGD